MSEPTAGSGEVGDRTPGRVGDRTEVRGGDATESLMLADLVSRVLDRGVVLRGEVVLGVAGVDLVYLGLDLLLSSVETLREAESGGTPRESELGGSRRVPCP